MPLHVTGVENTVRALGELKRKTGIKISTAIVQCNQLIFIESQRLVPKETGALAATARQEVTGEGFGARGTISYGDPSAGVDYAAVVHEDATAAHAPPTQFKYLAQAVRNRRAACQRVVGRQFLSGTEVK